MKKVVHLIFLYLLPFIVDAQFTWVTTNGPFGSQGSSIFSNQTYAFVPAEDFIFRSLDGIHWEKLEHPVSSYMAVYKDTLVNLVYDKVADTMRFQISANSGENWTSKRSPTQVNYYIEIKICRHGIYVNDWKNNYIYKSTDLGETWTTFDFPSLPGDQHLYIFDNYLYLTSNNSLVRTDSLLSTFEDITPPLPSNEYVGEIIVKDNHIVVHSKQYLYDSHDFGQTWNLMSSSLTSSPVVPGSTSYPNIFTSSGQYMYATIGKDLLRSANYGVSWDTLLSNLDIYSPRTVAVFNDLFLCNTLNKGVFRLDTIENKLIESNDGLSKGVVEDLSVGSNKIWAACGNGVFAFDIPTQTWSDKMNLPFATHGYEYISCNDIGWVLVSETAGTQFYLSQNDGLTWDTMSFSLIGDSPIDRVQLIHNVMFLFGDDKVFRSVDMGKHWEFVNVNYFREPEIVAFKGRLYLAGLFTLYSSDDNGINWYTIPLSYDIFEVHTFGDLLYSLAYAHYGIDTDVCEVYISKDGVEWTFANEGLDYYDFNGFATYGYQPAFFIRDADHHYGLLGWEGHYTSSLDENSWSSLPTSITGYAYAYHDNVVYLGQQGMYQSVIENPYVTAVEEVDKTDAVGLFTISPNPANDLITITLDSSKRFSGSIDIYSADGRRATSTSMDTSRKSFDIPVANFPSGLYYVMLQSKEGMGVQSFIKQ